MNQRYPGHRNIIIDKNKKMLKFRKLNYAGSQAYQEGYKHQEDKHLP
jgi:hypothetical protein